MLTFKIWPVCTAAYSFARKIICLPSETKKLQGSSIAIDIIITFYATPTELLTCYSRKETLMIGTAANK